jgi:hypothetical protein
MRRRVRLSSLLVALLLFSPLQGASSWEVTPPTWATNISLPVNFQWGNWIDCRPEYREFDCIDSVFWVKAGGERVEGVWTPVADFNYDSFTARYQPNPDGTSRQGVTPPIGSIGGYRFAGLVTPCELAPDEIMIDARAVAASFTVAATSQCDIFKKEFTERFEVTLKSNHLKGVVGGVSSNGRAPTISYRDESGMGLLTLSAKFAYIPFAALFNEGSTEYADINVCVQNQVKAEVGNWGLWNSLFWTSRPGRVDEALRDNPADLITGTNGWNCGGNLFWDAQEGALVMQVGAPHFDVDGKVLDGWFEGEIRGRYIKSRFGIEPERAAGNARLEVIYTEGEPKVATISATYSSATDILKFTAFGFTYSAPKLKLTFGEKPVPTSTSNQGKSDITTNPSMVSPAPKVKKKAISCVKNGKIKKVKTNSCPKGFKRI